MLLLITQFFACISLLFRIYNGKGNENITLFCIDVLHVRLASAQMTAAKKIPPAIEKKIVLKASAQKCGITSRSRQITRSFRA